jgi:hypothetical protein
VAEIQSPAVITVDALFATNHGGPILLCLVGVRARIAFADPPKGTSYLGDRPSHPIFLELRQGEVRRIYLPHTRVNRGKRKGRSPKRWDSSPVTALWMVKRARSPPSYAPG